MSNSINIRFLWLLAVCTCICTGLPATAPEDEQQPQEQQEETTTVAEPVVNEEAPTPVTQGAPKITYSKLTEVKDGETFAIDCEVKNVDLSGLPSFRILWGKVGTTESGTEKVIPISSNKEILLLSDRYKVTHAPNTYRYSLHVNSVNEKDSGIYRCTVVFGPDQKIDADVPVTVLTPAYFSDQTTKTIRVREGDAISIDCQPGGSPKPEVYWERLGEELPFYGGQFFKANQFELPLLDRTHVGNYMCYADNGLGEPATSEVIIEVEYKPSVALKETLIPASVYDQVVLECLSEAIPEPTVFWTRDDEKLSPSANIDINTVKDPTTGEILSKLKINQVQVDEFSDYKCVAENSLGRVEGTIRVEMKVPPSIEKQTKGELVYELRQGENRLRTELPIALECVSSGVPAPTYRWTKDGEVLLWQSDPRMTLEPGTGTLLIDDPDIEDNGVYQCFAHNELGVAASDEIHLTNNTHIDFLRQEPGDIIQEAEIGRPFRLRCPEAVGHPEPKLTWMKARQRTEGLEMEYVDGNRMVVDNDGTLWISHVLQEDDTEKNDFKYVCLASSVLHPKDISLAKTITLKTKPPTDGKPNLNNEHINIETFLMHSSPKEVNFKSNTENRLWCIFGGEPLPQVIWQRAGDKPITSERFFQENNGQTLVFKDTQLQDAGEYECVASNDVGEVKKLAINVAVEVVPRFAEDFKSQAQVVHEGTSVTFSCGILSEESTQAKYEWFFNSLPLKIEAGSRRSQDGSNLIITSASIADIGNYACKVSNEAGYAYGQTTLSVIPKASHLMVPSYENKEILRNINEKIEAITVDVQGLKEIVEQQAQTNQVRQKVLDLLNQIAKKVLADDYTPVVKPEAKVK